MFLIEILIMLILWTWGLTPDWVNTLGTLFMCILVVIHVIKLAIGVMTNAIDDK